MAKYVCPICGYVLEADSIPEGFVCPQCKCPGEKFKEQTVTENWASEHVVGIAADVPEDIKADLRANFEGECSEVGMKNLEMRVDAEYGATEGKTDLAKRTKALGLDAIHDTVHEMARDEARHGKALKGLLERYFK